MVMFDTLPELARFETVGVVYPRRWVVDPLCDNRSIVAAAR
jgi:hypothetical protein